MPAAVAREIVAWTRERGLDPHLNHLERLIVRTDDPRADEYGAFIGGDPELSGDLVESIRHPITKILAAGEPPLPSELAPLARERFDGPAAVTISHPRFLEFTAPGVSKGRAIRWLARRLRIPLGAVLAVGDQWNDIEMLAEVGHGAAMPTAPVEVRAVARYIAPPLSRGGRRPDDRGARARAAGPRRRAAAVRLAEEAAARRADADAASAADRRRERADRPRRRRRPGRGDRGSCAAAASSRCRPTRSTGSPSHSIAPGGIERLFQVKRRPPDKRDHAAAR